MSEAAVTQFWMAGVMATMVVFAVAAAVGYAIDRKRRSPGVVNDSQGDEPA